MRRASSIFYLAVVVSGALVCCGTFSGTDPTSTDAGTKTTPHDAGANDANPNDATPIAPSADASTDADDRQPAACLVADDTSMVTFVIVPSPGTVGQPLAIKVLSTSTPTSGGNTVGATLTICAPDGTTQPIGSTGTESDSTETWSFTFTPSLPGPYQFQFESAAVELSGAATISVN